MDLEQAATADGHRDGALWHFKRTGFLATFIVGPNEDPHRCSDTDVHVYLDQDGSHWTAMMFTPEQIHAVMERQLASGEIRSGWFWVFDLVVIQRPGLNSMLEVLIELVDTGQVREVLRPVEED